MSTSSNVTTMRKLLPAIIPLILTACTPDPVNYAPGQTQGYAPVYASTVDITKISFETARKTILAGKIYAFGNYIFQNDLNKGIHIINNRDKNHPEKIAFINLPFSTEIAVKGNFLYSNNLSDLVVFDVSDVANPKLIKRIANVFPPVNQKYPPFLNTAFECADPSKGIVVAWESKLITEPKCRR